MQHTYAALGVLREAVPGGAGAAVGAGLVDALAAAQPPAQPHRAELRALVHVLAGPERIIQ